MNKFRKMGLIDYNGELTVRTELLTDLLLQSFYPLLHMAAGRERL
jgi:hypothetical protein